MEAVVDSRLFVWSRDVEDAVPYEGGVGDGVLDVPPYIPNEEELPCCSFSKS